MVNPLYKKGFFTSAPSPEAYLGDLKADGTVPLTADWNVGAFDLTAVDLTATGNATANNLTASPTPGAEMNDNFASWTATSGWTYGSGKWTHSSGTTALTDDQSATFVAGSTYKVTIAYTWAGAGSTIAFSAGGYTYPLYISSAAASSVTFYFRAMSTTRLSIIPSTGFTGSIDSASIKLVTDGAIGNGGTTINAGQLFAPSGTQTWPGIAFSEDNDAGLWYSFGSLIYSVSGTNKVNFSTNSIGIYSDVGAFVMGASQDTRIGRESANVIQLGSDAASPSTQTLKAADTSANDTAGGDFRLKGGTSKGSGSGGAIYLGTTTSGAAAATDNTYIDRVKIDDTGTAMLGANSQATNIKQATVVVTTTAAATATATDLIPAGSMVVGVTCRNTTAVTGDAGFTGYSIGDGSDVDRWGANVNPAINETTDLSDCTITSVPLYAAATSVVLTQIGGSTFVADATIRVTVHYISLTAPAT